MRKRMIVPAALIVGVLALAAFTVFPPARAAVPVSGAFTAMSGGVVPSGCFVKLTTSDANTGLIVLEANAVTDFVLGVAESNAAAAGVQVRIAPPGTTTDVWAGLPVTPGALLTTGPNGYAVPIDANSSALAGYGGASPNRICGLALTGNSDANQNQTPRKIRILVVAGMAN